LGIKLVIGGKAQGKLAFAETLLPGAEIIDGGAWRQACHGTNLKKSSGQGQQVIVNHLHLLIRAELMDECTQEEILAELLQFADGCGTCMFICDEIGNGIVPMDAFERKWREQTGRILCGIAARADEVWRVFCGLPQKIK
jgi:adenosylcobinamide kinase/adenosylcobinamide-phosphate guanylyltransferase